MHCQLTEYPCSLQHIKAGEGGKAPLSCRSQASASQEQREIGISLLMSLDFRPHIGEELFGDGPPIGLGFGMTIANALSCLFGGFRDAFLVASRAISFQFLSWYRGRK